MFEFMTTVVNKFQAFGAAETAKFTAYCIAPASVLILTISGITTITGGGFIIDLGRPIVVTELKSAISSVGEASQRLGVAIIIEPAASEFRLQMPSPPTHVWSSLDESAAQANSSKLTFDRNGLHARAPFLGANGPVAIVVEGAYDQAIQVPGGIEKLDQLSLRSKRSVSTVAGALLACMFALGMSSVAGFPMNRKKDA